MKRLLLAATLLLCGARLFAQGGSTISQGVYFTSPPSPVSGVPFPLLMDSSGYLEVNVKAGSASNACASATGSGVPASGCYTSINIGGTLRGQTGVNPSGTVYAAQNDISSIGGTTVVTAKSGVLMVGLEDGSGNNLSSTGGALNVAPQSSTSSTAALSTYHVAATSTSTYNTIKSSAGNFYGFSAYNPNATVCYVMIYNSTAPTIGTTAPIEAWPIPALSQWGIISSTLALSNFGTGITSATTTTDGGASVCATGLQINALYD